jgi:stage III sporulation protein AH
MIIVARKIKIIALLIVLILVPIIAINLINWNTDKKSEPVSNIAAESDQLDLNNKIKITSQNSEEDFFAEYRIERERVRGKETGVLREIANNVSNDKKTRDIASLKLVELVEEAEKELQAEAMIKSQGFQDCAVIITPKSTTVMIESNGVQIQGQEQIRKAVSIATGCIEKNISVVTHHHAQQ